VDGAIDGRARDGEALLELADVVLAGAVELDQVRLLDGAELGLLAAQTTLGLGDLHPLARAQPDQVGLELSDHRQDVEQQPPDRIGRVVHGGAERELDLAAVQLVGDGTRVRQRASKAIELSHHQRVAAPARRQRFAQAGLAPSNSAAITSSSRRSFAPADTQTHQGQPPAVGVIAQQSAASVVPRTRAPNRRQRDP
jgi:hypothetical protein